MKKLTCATVLTFSLITLAFGQSTAPKILSESPEPLADGQVRVESIATANDPQLIVSSTMESATGGTSSRGVAVNGNPSLTSTESYRVGIGDVLDVKLSGIGGNQSTLFTIGEGGLLDYPLVSQPVSVSGLTTPEIAQLLERQIKILENPRIEVSVRDYASHFVTIHGFVTAPGVKALRREAVPLYVLLAEARVLAEATSVVINRDGEKPFVIDLSNREATEVLVVTGDQIKVLGISLARTDFFYVEGEVGAPGQKQFYSGLTLTQAIIASGSVRDDGVTIVRLSRQQKDGRLVTTEYDLAEIRSGCIPDPHLAAGDRLEVRKSQ